MTRKNEKLVDIFTTDVSALKLAKFVKKPISINSVIVPENRVNSEKVREIFRHSQYPVRIHSKKTTELSSDLLKADYFICWFYSQILTEPLLTRYQGGGINMHGGKIPEFRGANVLNWAIAEQEETLGVVWHLVVKEVDAGGIFCETELPISDLDTAESMRKRTISAGIELFPTAWKSLIESRAPIRYPNLGEGKVWPQRKSIDGKIKKNWSQQKVSALIRAQTGNFPNAFIEVGERKIQIVSVSNNEVSGGIKYQTKNGNLIWLIPQNETNELD